jgi:CheY-like chemotaxis protein
MKVLVVEDNDLKFGLIESCLQELGPVLSFSRVASYQSAIRTLVEETFDCVVLDMTLPIFDASRSSIGAENLTFGGSLILRECARRRINTKFIILSQYDTFVRDQKEVTFDELKAELLAKYTDCVVGCVKLDRSSVQWKSELKCLLGEL